MLAALGGEPVAAYKVGSTCMVEYSSERELRALRPDFGALVAVDCVMVLVTAPGDEYDCVSRCFAPVVGIPEDPATGSAHCTIAPHWADRLGKSTISAYQASSRGAEIECELNGARVYLTGSCQRFMTGNIEL